MRCQRHSGFTCNAVLNAIQSGASGRPDDPLLVGISCTLQLCGELEEEKLGSFGLCLNYRGGGSSR